MTDFKVVFDDRIYSVFFESSTVTAQSIEVKVILYNTIYQIYKDKSSGIWNNHISKFELSRGLLNAIGAKLDQYLNI